MTFENLTFSSGVVSGIDYFLKFDNFSDIKIIVIKENNIKKKQYNLIEMHTEKFSVRYNVRQCCFFYYSKFKNKFFKHYFREYNLERYIIFDF